MDLGLDEAPRWPRPHAASAAPPRWPWREGCSVAVCGRDPKKIRASADFIERETGRRVLAVTADVGSRGDCERFIGETVGAFGRLDILVANAGSVPPRVTSKQRTPRSGRRPTTAFSRT